MTRGTVLPWSDLAFSFRSIFHHLSMVAVNFSIFFSFSDSDMNVKEVAHTQRKQTWIVKIRQECSREAGRLCIQLWPFRVLQASNLLPNLIEICAGASFRQSVFVVWIWCLHRRISGGLELHGVSNPTAIGCDTSDMRSHEITWSLVFPSDLVSDSQVLFWFGQSSVLWWLMALAGGWSPYPWRGSRPTPTSGPSWSTRARRRSRSATMSWYVMHIEWHRT